MILARVTGNVVMTIKHPAFHAEKLLTVEAINDDGTPAGLSFIAMDRAQAGVGDTVLVLREGSGIRQITGRDEGIALEDAVKRDFPVRSMVVGVVDRIDVDGR